MFFSCIFCSVCTGSLLKNGNFFLTKAAGETGGKSDFTFLFLKMSRISLSSCSVIEPLSLPPVTATFFLILSRSPILRGRLSKGEWLKFEQVKSSIRRTTASLPSVHSTHEVEETMIYIYKIQTRGAAMISYCWLFYICTYVFALVPDKPYSLKCKTFHRFVLSSCSKNRLTQSYKSENWDFKKISPFLWKETENISDSKTVSF